jgi:hypothetical protein
MRSETTFLGKRAQTCRLGLGATLLLCTTAAGAATIGTSSYLQVNLSFMPFSYYDTAHTAASNGFSVSCPPNSSVRTCFWNQVQPTQSILGQMAAQGVTGIRVIITFCDNSSLAFTNCGSPYSQVSWNPSGNPTQQTWIQNVTNFFEDVHSSGIQNVTLTMSPSPGLTEIVPVTSTSSPQGSCSSGFCCSDKAGIIAPRVTPAWSTSTRWFPSG